MTWSIDGKHVLITGGTSGIGRATATELARRGTRVPITSRTLTSAAEAAARIGRESGADVTAAALDLSSLASIRELAGRYRVDDQQLHVLVNNAGTVAARRRITPDGLEWTMAVNHFGPFLRSDAGAARW